MRRFIICVLLLSACNYNTSGQESIQNRLDFSSKELNLEDLPLSDIQVDSAKWNETTKGLDYYEESKELPNKPLKKNTSQESLNLKSVVPILQVILILIVAAVLIALIVYINKQIKQNNVKLEEDDAFWQIDLNKSEEADKILSERLDNAANNEDYIVAIRLNYLKSLNELNRLKLVSWRKDKTNADYIKELKDVTFKQEFSSLTHYYENSWFGKFVPTKKSYQIISVAFDLFLSRLKSIKSGQE